jgi:hypothetical protein
LQRQCSHVPAFPAVGNRGLQDKNRKTISAGLSSVAPPALSASDAAQVAAGDSIDVRLAKGRLSARVTKTEP